MEVCHGRLGAERVNPRAVALLALGCVLIGVGVWVSAGVAAGVTAGVCAAGVLTILVTAVTVDLRRPVSTGPTRGKG